MTKILPAYSVLYTPFRTKRRKTIPCPAARPRIGDIREYPPLPWRLRRRGEAIHELAAGKGTLKTSKINVFIREFRKISYY